MRVELISFQKKAVRELREDIAEKLESYSRRKKTGIVSLQAPTGSGKTIMAAALIEGIYYGMSFPDGRTYTEQPDAIFVWLSDSPELNEQSRQKIETTTDLRFGQCVTISEDSFDMEMLEDGNVYFLNTQKISRTGKLTRHSDDRQYTIWETLDNTIQNKWDHLYFIIDEAHRGAKTQKESGKDTTIMQRFIKGYEYTENGVKRKMHSMPVVLGISATPQRFEALVGGELGFEKCAVTAEEVRKSGLLKDRIVITYPEDPQKSDDMLVLEAAVGEWMKKCRHWHQYTSEQHYANVDPVLVVQVCQGTRGALSDTNLEDVLAKIEEKAGVRFREGEVVHCFGEGAQVELNGLRVPHIKASEITNDHRVKVVLFKEALSTGWDCPRAETMMSFATRSDPTYIAQLLGRMVRTPLQMKVERDDFLNDVKLYLPRFDKDTVKQVVDALRSSEVGEIPTEINGESLEEPTYITWTARDTKRPHVFHPDPNQITLSQQAQDEFAADESGDSSLPFAWRNDDGDTPEYIPPQTITVPADVARPLEPAVPQSPVPAGRQLNLGPEMDRMGIIQYINEQAFLSYSVRQERINDYLKSLVDLADLLTHSGIYGDARMEVIQDVTQMIHDYAEELRRSGRYEKLASQVLEFKLSVQVFDPFGKAISNNRGQYVLMSESDLDRQVRDANVLLGGYGFDRFYGQSYFNADDPNAYKIDFVLFAADHNCKERLGAYAKDKLWEFAKKYRVQAANKSEECRLKYTKIMADSDEVTEQSFVIPENITVRDDPGGIEYDNHLFVSETTGVAKIKLNAWEAELIEKESAAPDFVCWLRNLPRASWALCLPYEMNGEKKAFYPDFLIVRSSSSGYTVDVLEPHGNQFVDNLPKAKALAKYAGREVRLGRIQLIHKTSENRESRFIRLELTDPNVKDKVLRANTDEELANIFENYGERQ